MPFGMLSGVFDVIISLYVNRSRGFSWAAPPKVPFPILIRTTLTTVLHYRADCDSDSEKRTSAILEFHFQIRSFRDKNFKKNPHFYCTLLSEESVFERSNIYMFLDTVL